MLRNDQNDQYIERNQTINQPLQMWPKDFQGGLLYRNAFSKVRTEQMGPVKVQDGWINQNGPETFWQQQIWPNDVQR